MSPLLNYTTTVTAARSIDAVQRVLVRAGARSISTSYSNDGDADGIAFQVTTAYGPRWFALPVNARPVLEVLVRQNVPRRYQTPEHAERVAWRILKDWLDAQLAIIETGMVSLDQVMLPYMHADDSGLTVWEHYQSSQLALPRGSE